MSNEKKCHECVFCIQADFGYSNYTVEGTEINCAKNLNPDMPFDRWYGHDKRSDFASTCSEFIQGDPVHLDCDLEDIPYKVKYGDEGSESLEKAFEENYGNGYVTGKQIREKSGR